MTGNINLMFSLVDLGVVPLEVSDVIVKRFKRSVLSKLGKLGYSEELLELMNERILIFKLRTLLIYGRSGADLSLDTTYKITSSFFLTVMRSTGVNPCSINLGSMLCWCQMWGG